MKLAIAALALYLLPLPACATTVRQRAGAWEIENTRLRVTVSPESGQVAVFDKQARYQWAQATGIGASVPFRGVRADRDGIACEAEFPAGSGRRTLRLRLAVPDRAADLVLELDAEDRTAPIADVRFLAPFGLAGDGGSLVVADYCDGHIYSLGAQPFPRTYFDADRLDMPWLGVCDLQSGRGYALILDTSDDAYVTCPSCTFEGRRISLPVVTWRPSKGSLGYARRITYRFVSRGGYVALAKAYRQTAREQGLLVTLREKLKKNPNLARLFGAPDVWGDASLGFARAAKAAGVEKMLIHGRTSRAEMDQVRDLGYLTSEYDNYTDVLPVEPGKPLDAQHDQVPGHVVLRADNQRMTAWLTFDKKTQFMKRCPACWLDAAKAVVPKALAELPFVGRFIDVTTAEALYECYDPAHPLTKGDKRQCGEELLKYVRSQGLVVGGEHGIWWGVPHLDYIEGMMSGGHTSWPAGHLIHPKTKADTFTDPWGGKSGSWADYEQWGIGHATRVPLWELVFHDCVVSTWYWGDSSDFLIDAAPEVTVKKDAFNILYGTIPLLWADRQGGWRKDREAFLRTYRNTCKLHEALAGAEMVSHEFLTPDRAVQRTRFSDGTVAIVNFGDAPYTAELGARYLLPKYGWAVRGPKIQQSRALVGDKVVTSIKSARYTWTETQAP